VKQESHTLGDNSLWKTMILVVIIPIYQFGFRSVYKLGLGSPIPVEFVIPILVGLVIHLPVGFVIHILVMLINIKIKKLKNI